MSARVVGAVARHESERKSARLRSKAEETAAAGRVNGGGHRPFGFEKDRISHRADEADALRWAARQVILGESLRALCASMPLPPVAAAAWSPGPLRRALIAPRTAGLREHRGEIVGPALWGAIIDRETWEQCRNILSDPARLMWKPAARYLLSGGLIIDYLGRAMFARPDASKRRCYISLPTIDGPGVKIGAEDVDAMVLEMVRNVAVGNLEQLPPQELPGDDIELLEAKLTELRNLRAAEIITMQDWLVLRQPLQDKLATAKPSTRVDAAALLRRYDSLSIAELRAVVGELISNVRILPAQRGRNTFDRHRVMITLKLGGIAVP